jgi:hypothetical protein
MQVPHLIVRKAKLGRRGRERKVPLAGLLATQERDHEGADRREVRTFEMVYYL